MSKTPEVPDNPMTDIRFGPVGDLTFATEYNRAINPAWVEKLVRELTSPSVAVIDVSERANGDLVIIDGQHRAWAIIEKWGDKTDVTYKVHHDLTIPEEAALFRVLNTRKGLTPYARFQAAYVEKDPTVVAIVKTLESHGLGYADSPRETTIGAVAALRRVAEVDIDLLDRTLDLLIMGFGASRDTWNSAMIIGAGNFLQDYPEAELPVLVRKLRKYRAGPAGFLGDAKGLRTLLGKSEFAAVTYQLVVTYNRNRSEGRRLDNKQ
jgi:hypothetical protein